MTQHTNYRALINRGRKAGLTTGEIYSAMGTRSGEGTALTPGMLDGNGFVTAYDQQGRLIYRPADQSNRS
jgi:hypothetical protein